MPWIHVADWVSMVLWLIQSESGAGAFNATAPQPVTNRDFTRTLGRVLRRPAVLRAPALVLRLALGEMSCLLITGQRAVPARAEQLGFKFTFQTLEPALQDILGVSDPDAGKLT
jgi:NAD dependent epimerase/dehydratase family enzyme